MKVIVGLGNPGSEYAHTRHNIGFEVIDSISEQHGIRLSKSKFNALFGKGTIDGEELLLVKPLTYMNASGEAVGPLLRFFKVSAEDLLVVQDDMDLPVGKIRLRQKGSAGGHNGIKSIIQHVKTQEFARIKVGIGHPQHTREAVVRYVLQGFSGDEQMQIASAIERSSDAAKAWITLPFTQVMNVYNTNK
ncbi:aminoacyl-tRNA hydrolase [Sporolactobacillus nakayamae]|uniref:Peptidyl-tRNA hydrolase n=1 Tax=Sporolactobacillus nakayamae TaxID=269670 RepID=A0A1I2URK0_9BACL|nr:aminoacyl-tRNA hydrolase [Sporolactobacillus nakayamae]SFG77381.1 peptidyl-tRNA hydrolase, PTH1 family [Sporolactobacillus nakayamae]